MPKHPKRRTRRNLAVLALSALCLTGFLYWDNTALQVTRFDPVFFRICPPVLMAAGSWSSATSTAPRSVRTTRTCWRLWPRSSRSTSFSGDLEDKYRGPEDGYPAETARGLSAIAPTYYVTGNHEWAVGGVPALKEILTANGVTVLSNQFVPLERNGDTIVLAGIDDPNGYADQKTPEELAAEVYAACGDPFWILLAHRNNRFARQYSLLGADLVCSGHAHGGIVRLPGTDGLFSHDLDLFPSYTAGLYEENGSVLFVTRGLGNSGPSFRVFNRPEIAVLTLRRAEG